jgi:hypothetical protein
VRASRGDDGSCPPRSRQRTGARPSLQHFRVDPERLAVDEVIVCEYLTFTEVMQQADVQLYA